MKKKYVSPVLSVLSVEDVIRTSTGGTSNLPPEVTEDNGDDYGHFFPIG